jgi:proline iminopeptidase
MPDGLLDVGDGQLVYWEEHGNPDGVPVVILHGGPGSGLSPFHRSFFDETRYRIVQFDQRGCGKSTPHASDPSIGFAYNTFGHLIDDIDRLRADRGVERWIVFGMSFGSTLGVAYAETHPQHVRGLVVAGAALGSKAEIDWLYQTLAPLFPEQWERFTEGLSPEERAFVVAAYRDRVNGDDSDVRAEFARRWTEWDWHTASVTPSPLPAHWQDPAFQLARARICTHYFTGDVLLAGEQLVKPHHVERLQQIDGSIVNGRLDLQCPLANALELHRLWPRAELVIVDDAGHSVGDTGMGAAITAAVGRLAGHG